MYEIGGRAWKTTGATIVAVNRHGDAEIVVARLRRSVERADAPTAGEKEHEEELLFQNFHSRWVLVVVVPRAGILLKSLMCANGWLRSWGAASPGHDATGAGRIEADPIAKSAPRAAFFWPRA
jgi:hypothetical protein